MQSECFEADTIQQTRIARLIRLPICTKDLELLQFQGIHWGQRFGKVPSVDSRSYQRRLDHLINSFSFKTEKVLMLKEVLKKRQIPQENDCNRVICRRMSLSAIVGALCLRNAPFWVLTTMDMQCSDADQRGSSIWYIQRIFYRRGTNSLEKNVSNSC